MHIYRKYALCAAFAILVLVLLESRQHVRSFQVARPDRNLDEGFGAKERCEGGMSANATTPRENAVIFMLARNDELKDALQAVRSLEKHWNHRYQYPYVFANNEPWSEAFKQALTQTVSGTATFETIPQHMWGFRNGTTFAEQQQAIDNMAAMAKKKIPHAANLEYHNMCRFHSGFFYDLPALASYDWYWRVEPDSRYTCDIPYDPFVEMAAHKKVYGYAIALWEVGSTAPSLFRTIDDYRLSLNLQPSSLWTTLHDASWGPYALRSLGLSALPSRNKDGDAWNLCHFWSNFEIAPLAFYRSNRYRRLFEHLDQTGGFHLERWGDAAVHSLALAMFLQPEELHWFGDIGYKHKDLQNCPSFGEGCGCECDSGEEVVDGYCLARIREAVDAAAL